MDGHNAEQGSAHQTDSLALPFLTTVNCCLCLAHYDIFPNLRAAQGPRQQVLPSH